MVVQDKVEAVVDSNRQCDFCKKEAKYDGRVAGGSWAYMCQEHFDRFGVGLGTGKGQKLIVGGK